MFSIIIPTWNNFKFIQLCVESIRKNSALRCQIILHINDGSDGTLEWAKQQNILFSYTPDNAGICIAVNMAAQLATNKYIIYMNDDMYCCPNWDKYLAEEINSLPDDNFMLSATMIEFNDTNNDAKIIRNFGTSVESFDEEGLLKALPSLHKNDWSGATWPPCVISKNKWNIIGGFSIEFSPGMASDDDFSMKMWHSGCRYFKGIGKSLVYHFQSKSTQRIKRNNGRKQFLLKWECNASTFNKYYIKKGKPFEGILQEPSASVLKKDRMKVWYKKKFVY